MTVKKTKVLIIGSGPAGCTAAIYASRALLKPILIAGNEPGGQLTITTDVENYPGFADIIQGPWLMEQMKTQAIKAGTEFIQDTIIEFSHTKSPFKFKTQNNLEIEAETVVICTGAQAKWLGIQGENEYRGRGVSSCATCDGFFYKDMDVCVVGGGNTAVEEALYLSKICKSVTIIHRRDTFRAEKTLQNKLFAQKNIEILWNHQLIEVLPDSEKMYVEHTKLLNTQIQEEIIKPFQGVFIAIGHQPNTVLFKNILEMDDEGYISTKPNSTATSVEGIYAAGDVQDKIYRQAITAASSGCMAVLEIEKGLD